MTGWAQHDPGAETLVLAGPVLNRPLPRNILTQAGIADAPQIAIDGGMRYASSPFLWAGDGDSGAKPTKIPAFVKHDQNETDLRFCLNGIRDWHWRELHLFGFIGDRRDHELANFGEVYAEMKQRRKFQKAVFYDEGFRPHVLFYPSGEHIITRLGLFSFLAFERSDVSIEGRCRYPANALQIPALSGKGLSNEGAGEVTVRCSNPFAIVLPQHG